MNNEEEFNLMAIFVALNLMVFCYIIGYTDSLNESTSQLNLSLNLLSDLQ